MVRRLAWLIGALSIGVVSFCSTQLPALPQVSPGIFIPGASATATGVFVQGDIGGQGACKFTLGGTWSGTVQAAVQAINASSAAVVPIWDDSNIEYKTGVTANGTYIFYPQSGGTVLLNVSAYTSGTITAAGINCSPSIASHPNTDALGNQVVSFATAQPINIIVGGTPIPVTTPAPIASVTISGSVLMGIGATPLPVVTPPPTTTVAVSSLSVGATPLPVSTGLPCANLTAGGACKSSIVDPVSGTPFSAASPWPVTTPPPTTSVGITGSVPITISGTPFPVTTPGSVSITGTVPVSGTVGISGTVPISGSVGITIVTTPIPVTTPPPTTSVSVSSVSGTVTTSGTTTLTVGATPLPVTTPAPVASIFVTNASSFPTPIPTAVPQPIATASSGASPPPNAPWVMDVPTCQYNGSNVPGPLGGNLISCQADNRGSIITSQSATSSILVFSTGSTTNNLFLNGQNYCSVGFFVSSGTASITFTDAYGNTVAGPFTASFSATTKSFSVVTPGSYDAIGNLGILDISVSGLTGARTLQLSSYCGANSPFVFQSAPWQFTPTDSSGNPYAIASPLPVTTPAPIPTNGAGAIVVTTPPPTTSVSVTQVSSPWVVSGTVTVNTPAPYSTMVPGSGAWVGQNVLNTQVLGPGGLALSGAAPLPVTTAAPGPTPIPYTSASPMPVVFPTPFALSYVASSPLPVSTPSTAPAPTASAGASPSLAAVPVNAQMLCFFTAALNSISGGNSYATKCDKLGNLRTTSAEQTATIASAAASTCTSAMVGPDILVDIIYANASAQTGTLEVFNEGATPTCAAADLIWVSVAHPAGGMELINHFAISGIAYEWLTAGQSAGGKVLIDTNP